MSILKHWSFLFIYSFICFLGGAQIGFTFPLSISHEFEQFGSLHMCAPRKYICCSRTQTWYPRAESTTLPMSYPGAMYMLKYIFYCKFILLRCIFWIRKRKKMFSTCSACFRVCTQLALKIFWFSWKSFR